MNTTPEIWDFHPYRLDVTHRGLRRDHEEISLTPKAFDTLVELVRHHGAVLRKQDLIAKVWSDTFVEDAVLTQNIYTLRGALGDRKAPHRIIATVPRVGYRFIAPVRAHGAAPSRPVGALAVLPFVQLGENEEPAMLGIGLADALITRLGGLGEIAVRPTSAVLALPAEDRTPERAARALGVDGVVEGRLQQSGDRIRVTVQLVDPAGDVALWGTQLDEHAGDLLTLQDILARRLSRALQLQLDPIGGGKVDLGTRIGPAFNDYVAGRFHWSARTREELFRAIDCFQRAVKRDPDWALPRVGLAECYVLLPFYADLAPRESFAAARREAESALRLEPQLAAAKTVLGYTYFVHDHDRERAEEELREAIELDPACANGHHWYAFFLAAGSRFEEATIHAARAIDLDPLSLIHNADLSWVLHFARQYAEALEQFEVTLELDPTLDYARYGMALTLLALGRHDEALEQSGQAAASASASSVAQAVHIHVLGRLGEHRRADLLLEQQLTSKSTPASRVALALAGHRPGEALEALRRAADERSRFAVFAAVWDVFDALRERPSFHELIADMGLDIPGE